MEKSFETIGKNVTSEEVTEAGNKSLKILTSKEIIKKENDSRDYSFQVLQNGLRLLIISDPKTDFSACAFRVDAGSFEEPTEYLGLAHFLEHMLFLGSKKYPESDEYEDFFNKFGGYSNAWTSDNYTTYNFEISDHS